MNRLYDKLKVYSKDDYYPMHMPGHKRNTKMLPMGNPYEIDITEIEGFDNLHQAEGILKQLSERIANLYKAEKSYPLVNGSTVGILAGISAATNKGDKILIARNSHKSVYHAAILRELEPVYSYPQPVNEKSVNGGILASEIEELLIKYPEIKLVVVTSPTYEGVVSDIKEISGAVHRRGALLLVDEAHGAHFGFHQSFPQSSVTLGADLVIQSLHKTLPAFTQTAVLHSNRPDLNHKIEQYLSIYQSSSPSYLLMSGMDRCIAMLEDNAGQLFEIYNDNLNNFKEALKGLNNLSLLDRKIIGKDGVFDLDPSKLTIFTGNTGYTGHELGKLLREKYKIVVEMEAKDYVLAMTSICDTREGFDRLSQALLAIDRKTAEVVLNSPGKELRTKQKAAGTNSIKNIMKLTPYQAMERESETIGLSESLGRISSAFLSLFPPGSPILVPGEIINEEVLCLISQALKEGLTVTGLTGHNNEIEVIR